MKSTGGSYCDATETIGMNTSVCALTLDSTKRAASSSGTPCADTPEDILISSTSQVDIQGTRYKLSHSPKSRWKEQ
ncbi:hypothetical protein HispidOSU_011349, partial [Sigmodon hispidus]